MDAVRLSLYSERLSAIAAEMGLALRRSAFSANIKERRDFSCALFLGDGTLVAEAAHIPVHLGAMMLSVEAARDALALGPGDVAILNDPFHGGTHLPDVTLVQPVFLVRDARRPQFFVANRAHHADVGGAVPGSMGLARDIHAEGVRIPPVHLVRGGRRVPEVWRLFLAQVRQPDERQGDLAAQLAANGVGERGLRELAGSGRAELLAAARALPSATERAMRAAIAELRPGRRAFEDALDDDGFGHGPLAIRVAIDVPKRGRRVRVDFAGSAPQTEGPVNCNLAVTLSAVGYAFRCLLGPGVPQNGGVFRCLDVRAPEGSIVNARPPAAVAAGNVEASQRIVDVVLGALAGAGPRIPAASAGTMSNVSFGNARFTWYETIGGGSGASSYRCGAHAVQTHMTNTLNTPIEVIEAASPLRVVRYAVRRGSGGAGARRGGDGIVRELEALEPMSASILADRHASRPYGLAGGGGGRPGRSALRRRGGARRLPAKCSFALAAGDRVRIESPGGGGHGR